MTRHLRGGPHFSRFVQDSLSEHGAHYMAGKIREFWMQKGFTIRTIVEPIPGGFGNHHFQIRSNMVNGMPVLGRRP